MDNKLREITFFIEMINRNRQVNKKFGQWYKFAFAVWRKREANLSIKVYNESWLW